jgi:hypothetical protein
MVDPALDDAGLDARLIVAIGQALYGQSYKADLARALGVSRDTVDDWGKGRMRPRPGVWPDLERLVLERLEQLERLVPGIRAAGAGAARRAAETQKGPAAR